MIKPYTDIWQIGYDFSRDYKRLSGYRLSVWCLNMHKLPRPYHTIAKGENYKGFYWQVSTPHSTSYYAFRNPLARWFGYAVLVLPTKWSVK